VPDNLHSAQTEALGTFVDSGSVGCVKLGKLLQVLSVFNSGDCLFCRGILIFFIAGYSYSNSVT
jgi:hypothetical protein